ncbi:MAG: VOC family protein [Acidimicrobiia bacterium]
MAQLSVGPVHHIRLSVNDLERSRAFYTELLGFQVARTPRTRSISCPSASPCSPSGTRTAFSWN